MAGITLSLVEFISFIGGNIRSRCVIEGEEVLNARHIILHGKTEWTSTTIDVCAICLQTSSLQSNPHEIYGKLQIHNGSAKVAKMHCSCKAGAGGQCKHIAAFLILLTRYLIDIKCVISDLLKNDFVFRENLAELEAISKTQLTCAWSNQKSSVQDKYKAVPVKDMPCIVAKANNRKMDLSDDSVCSETSILEYFIKKLPNSTIAKHK